MTGQELLAWLYGAKGPPRLSILRPFRGRLYEEALDAAYRQLPRRDRYSPEVGDVYLSLGTRVHQAFATG